ncbi:agmatinase, partial [bacterium]|nr:agmatinase [bacterium]
MLARNVETFLGCDSCYRTADIVLYGAPFDSTTSFRPGARFGPSAIRHESFGLETYSPYQNADLTDFDIFDSGDLELCFGSAESALNDIESRAAEILRDNKLPLLLGGEHLVTLGAVRAVLRRFPDLHIVHFDAHADLRQHYLGAQLSHACVLRRCHDLLGDGRIHQFCIRSGEREEFAFAANFNPEVNLREVSAPGSYWEDGRWVEVPAMSIKREYDFDQVGRKEMYL